MNRIERLVWEETHLSRIGRLQRESHRATGLKIVSIVFIVGAIALLATRISIPPLDEAVVRALTPESVVYSPAAGPNAGSHAGSTANTPVRDSTDAAARGARHDDPPIAMF
jgi:hypothetical protein